MFMAVISRSAVDYNTEETVSVRPNRWRVVSIKAAAQKKAIVAETGSGIALKAPLPLPLPPKP
jgi:hypothetical protein